MGFLSKFEGKMEDTVEGMASGFGGSSLSPVQITKKAEKQMRREKIVGAGVQHAPTLYTVLVSQEDDARLFGYYPTLAGEVETYLAARANEIGLDMDGQPLVRFLADPELKRGKFDVVAEMVAAPIIAQLRSEEMQRYGLATPSAGPRASAYAAAAATPSSFPARAAASRSNVAFAVKPSVSKRPFGQIAGKYNPAQYDSYNDYNYGGNGSGYSNPFDEVAEPRTTVMNAMPNAAVQPKSAGGRAPEVYLYDEDRDRAYQLTGRPERIGRESANDVVIPDINVSRVHAEIRREPNGSWVITDLNSTNGLFINGRQVQTAVLRDADMITLGTSELEFQLLDD